jgi:hypothetical protein
MKASELAEALLKVPDHEVQVWDGVLKEWGNAELVEDWFDMENPGYKVRISVR